MKLTEILEQVAARRLEYNSPEEVNDTINLSPTFLEEFHKEVIEFMGLPKETVNLHNVKMQWYDHTWLVTCDCNDNDHDVEVVICQNLSKL